MTEPPGGTKLFLVSATYQYDDTDLSAIVEATDANDAVNQWHDWLKVFHGYQGWIETPSRSVFELPERTGKSCFFNWHTEDGVKEHEI